MRQCSRTRCTEVAVATMTYQYEDATAVVGPLSPTREKGALDFCIDHANSVTVPHGWSIVRLTHEYEPSAPQDSDLMALANAMRAVSVDDASEDLQVDKHMMSPSEHRGALYEALHERKTNHLSLVDNEKDSNI